MLREKSYQTSRGRIKLMSACFWLCIGIFTTMCGVSVLAGAVLTIAETLSNIVLDRTLD
ncbi:MAG: hypothetical protein K2H97_03565 [Prevotella sp.]|jgi:hypothetical protein|nr:hypothetical protein [Prevotella sp.]